MSNLSLFCFASCLDYIICPRLMSDVGSLLVLFVAQYPRAQHTSLPAFKFCKAGTFCAWRFPALSGTCGVGGSGGDPVASAARFLPHYLPGRDVTAAVALGGRLGRGRRRRRRRGGGKGLSPGGAAVSHEVGHGRPAAWTSDPARSQSCRRGIGGSFLRGSGGYQRGVVPPGNTGAGGSRGARHPVRA